MAEYVTWHYFLNEENVIETGVLDINKSVNIKRSMFQLLRKRDYFMGEHGSVVYFGFLLTSLF